MTQVSKHLRVVICCCFMSLIFFLLASLAMFKLYTVQVLAHTAQKKLVLLKNSLVSNSQLGRMCPVSHGNSDGQHHGERFWEGMALRVFGFATGRPHVPPRYRRTHHTRGISPSCLPQMRQCEEHSNTFLMSIPRCHVPVFRQGRMT